MHRGSYYDSVLAIEMKSKINISVYYGTQVVFFFVMLVSLYDVIICDVISIENFREILRYFF